MQRMKIEMHQEKVTKNTVRYAAVDEESPVPTVYVKKSGLPEPAPQAITLTIDIGSTAWRWSRQELRSKLRKKEHLESGVLVPFA